MIGDGPVFIDNRTGRRYAVDEFGRPFWVPDPPPTRNLRTAPHRDRRPSLAAGLAKLVVYGFALAGALHVGRLLYLALQ